MRLITLIVFTTTQTFHREISTNNNCLPGTSGVGRVAYFLIFHKHHHYSHLILMDWMELISLHDSIMQHYATISFSPSLCSPDWPHSSNINNIQFVAPQSPRTNGLPGVLTPGPCRTRGCLELHQRGGRENKYLKFFVRTEI